MVAPAVEGRGDERSPADRGVVHGFGEERPVVALPVQGFGDERPAADVFQGFGEDLPSAAGRADDGVLFTDVGAVDADRPMGEAEKGVKGEART